MSVPRAFSNTRCISGARVGPAQGLKRRVVVRADPDEEEFEARLARINKSKVPTGVSRKDLRKAGTGTEDAPKKAPVVVNYEDEVLWREFSPSNADLAFNLVMAATLIWIPLTVSAIGRCAFVKYRVTNKRIVVQADAPWRKEESNIGFHEIAKVEGVNRGLGAWGDMVITVDGGDKLELRSVAGWQEIRDYIMERRDAIRGKDLTQDELLGGKGFSS